MTVSYTHLDVYKRQVQRHINIINQREAFADDDATRIMVNEAMQDITFNFSKIGADAPLKVREKDKIGYPQCR